MALTASTFGKVFAIILCISGIGYATTLYLIEPHIHSIIGQSCGTVLETPPEQIEAHKRTTIVEAIYKRKKELRISSKTQVVGRTTEDLQAELDNLNDQTRIGLWLKKNF